MATTLPATVRLNNYLQESGRLQEISYFERDNGRAAEHRWTVILKINGEVMGSCDDPRKAIAKEAAAEQALMNLGVE